MHYTPGQNIERKERQEIAVIENLPLLEEDRMNLVLAYLGVKPCAEVVQGGPSSISSTEALVAIEERKRWLVETLNALGLRVKLLEVEEVSEKGILVTSLVFLVGKNEELVKRLEQAFFEKDHYTRGKLLGYPETAVEAFARGMKEGRLEEYIIYPHEKEKRWWLSLSEEERQRLLEEGVMNFLTFRLSWEHWREELETVRRWQGIIREYAPKVYGDIIKGDLWGNQMREWEKIS